MSGLKEVINRIRNRDSLARQLADTQKELADLKRQVAQIEGRVINYYRNRWDAVDNLADYLVGAELPGDYLEFGVYQGATFGYVCKLFQSVPALSGVRFLAFDSFEGLPEPTGVDRVSGYSSSFFAGQYRFPLEQFTENIKAAGADLSRVRMIKGWFDKTLTAATAQEHKIEKVAAAWIDCDFYESTVPVLDFLTPRLSVGSVLLFDDWRCFRNLPEYGEQKACAEWLARNPNLVLHPFISFGFHGQAFTVGRI